MPRASKKTASSAVAPALDAAPDAAAPTAAATVPTQDPRPANSSVNPVGRWQAHHPHWQGIMEFLSTGSFKAPKGGFGTWSFDRRTLRLVWSTPRPPELLELEPDGTFLGNAGFVLRKLV